MNGYLTEGDLADRLGVTEAKVSEWRRQHGWPHLKIGRQVRFTETDVRAIESLHHVGSKKPAGLPDQTARSIARSA